MKSSAVLLCALLLFTVAVSAQRTDRNGRTLRERFAPPSGYRRISYPSGSFAEYLRDYPLKPYGSPVLLYDGTAKRNRVHVSVFDMPILKSDLIQCADAIIKLRAEYLYAHEMYREISFTLTNGMEVPFSRFAQGQRVSVKGNRSTWKTGGRSGYGRRVFDEYLRFIYMFAGTYSLSRELKSVPLTDISCGDIFIFGGMPGHAVMVIDLAENPAIGEKIMLLGQSYMPSQEFHILKSPCDISPWYRIEDNELLTPEWTFERGSLMRFR